jgi:hypothetical protein
MRPESIAFIHLGPQLGARREREHHLRWSPRETTVAPCAGDGLVLSGGDAAALLCWADGTARAYHLGF